MGKHVVKLLILALVVVIIIDVVIYAVINFHNEIL
jgi:hypothetical protein